MDPNRPAGHSNCTPPEQYVPGLQAACPVRRWGSSGPLPTEKLPGPTTRGAPDPAGQKNPGAAGLLALPPHTLAWLVALPAAQKKPAVQGPLHAGSPRRVAHPNLPAGQGCATPLVQ